VIKIICERRGEEMKMMEMMKKMRWRKRKRKIITWA